MSTLPLSSRSRWLAVAGLLLLTAPSGAQIIVNPPVAIVRPPALLLNEVLFDETGADSASQLGSEWVELYAVTSVQLGNYALTDNLGTPLGTLPNVSVPANSVVLIILGGGSTPWNPDADLSDGTGAYMLGLSKTDHLDNASGGVRLLNAQGSIIDSVYWGIGAAPSGATGLHWVAGSYYDISMAGQPMNEGDSIGRAASPVANYSGKKKDWQSNGGANAAGPTPKGRNGVEKANVATLIKYTQQGINQVVTGFGEQVDAGWFTFTDAAVGTPTVDQSADTLTVTALHTFNIAVHGVPSTLTGEIETIFLRDESPDAVGYTMSSAGTLTSPSGFSFELDHAETYAGFHTNSISGNTYTYVTYTEGSIPYEFSVVGLTSLTRTGLDTWVLQDDRTCEDYGGAGPKSSTATTTITRTADGSYSSTFALDRDFPIAPPDLGDSQDIQFVEKHRIDTTSTMIGDFGEYSSVITRAEFYHDNVLVTELEDGMQGSSNLDFAGASLAEPLGSATAAISLPLTMGTIGGTMHATQELVGDVLKYSVVNTVTYNDSPVQEFSFVVDPPLQSGGGGGGTAPAPAPPPPAEPEGFLDSVADCATKGGAVGAGAGTAVGGVAGYIGGAAVGTAVGALGGPPGMAAAATAGGPVGAAAGGTVGAGVGAVAGAGVGSLTCAACWLWNWI